MTQHATTTSGATGLTGRGPCPVADTMLRVHDQLRQGAAPSFEALLAHGEPGRR